MNGHIVILPEAPTMKRRIMVKSMRISFARLALLAAMAVGMTAGAALAQDGSRGVQRVPTTSAPTAAAPVAAPAVPAAVTTERRVALVIGNGAYRNAPALTNPPNDARTIAEVLQGAGFELVGGQAMLDLDRAATEKAIRAFGQQLRGGSVGLFYYAGHGLQISGANYLVPVSAQISSEADVKYELVDLNFVLDEMVNAGNRLNMILLDACRNNPFSGRGMRSVSGGLAQMQAPSGTVISYATQPGNVAADGSDGHSPYTAALAESIRTPGRSVFDVFNAVGLTVKKRTGDVQQPWLSASPIEGQFYFVPTSAPAPTVAAATAAGAPAVPAADKEALYWESIKNSRNPAFYQAYLEQFPTGVFAGLARAKLAAIPPSPSPTATASATPGNGPSSSAMRSPSPAPAPGLSSGPLFDPEAVPNLLDRQKPSLHKYQTGPQPKALAVGQQGHFAYYTNGSGELTEAEARRRALERCQFSNGAPCVLYAVGNVVLQPDPHAWTPTPVYIKGSGRFDPAAVPFVSQSARDTKMVNFAAAREHKALAVHPAGAWGWSVGQDSVDHAKEVALENCAKFEETGCIVYAVDNLVILDRGEDGQHR